MLPMSFSRATTSWIRYKLFWWWSIGCRLEINNFSTKNCSVWITLLQSLCISTVPGTIGTLQALEAIKLLSGVGASYVGKMLLFDGFRGGFTEVKLRPKQSTCSACGDNATILALLEDYPQFCGAGYDDKVKLIKTFFIMLWKVREEWRRYKTKYKMIA